MRPMATSLLAVLMLFGCFAIDSSAQTQGPPTIVVSKLRAKSTTIAFTPQELRRLEREPKVVLDKMLAHTGKCCTSAQRLSSCIWVCCGGTRIRTCDATLVRALERLWGE